MDTIHRLQKAYPYDLRDVSHKWAFCANNADKLTRMVPAFNSQPSTLSTLSPPQSLSIRFSEP